MRRQPDYESRRQPDAASPPPLLTREVEIYKGARARHSTGADCGDAIPTTMPTANATVTPPWSQDRGALPPSVRCLADRRLARAASCFPRLVLRAWLSQCCAHDRWCPLPSQLEQVWHRIYAPVTFGPSSLEGCTVALAHLHRPATVCQTRMPAARSTRRRKLTPRRGAKPGSPDKRRVEYVTLDRCPG